MRGKTSRTGPLFLDSGAVSRLARTDQQSAADIQQLKRAGYWPPIVHTVVLAESVSGRAQDDVQVDRLIKTCRVQEELLEGIARRAGDLRAKTGRGSVVDALLVAMAEDGGAVMTDDLTDVGALASNARDVTVVSSKPKKR